MAAVFVALFRSRRHQVMFLALASVFTLAYAVVLPFEYTQRLALANLGHLTARLAVFTTVLGVGMASLATLQAFAVRHTADGPVGSGGGLAALVSLIPTMACCSPLVPTVLGIFGLSAMGLASTSGAIQYFFATHQGEFLAVATAMITGSLFWSARKVARSQCGPDGSSCTTKETAPTR